MTEEIQVTIKAIDENSPHLQSVIALGDANKATLSFFPDGAFRRHAASSQIIVAIDSQSGCIGYLLYGASRRYNRITIIHLCISPSHKGRGVARKLVDYLIQLTQKYSGIGLTCRRDYQLGNFWAKLGFIAQYDEPAKTQKKINTYWWLDHGHPNLFSTAATYRRDSKLCVIIDANIFFNLSSNENNIAIDESKILLTDWLQGELDLCLTDEIFNKINHIHDPYNRKLQYNFAKRFTCLPCKNQIMDETLRHLQNFFIQNNISLDESELRYLAKTIAVDSYIFVTHDSRLLNVSDDIYESFRLSVIRPKELINQLEDLQGKPEYQPVRLGGTSLNYTCVRNIQNATLNKYFQGETKSVNKAQFQQKIRRFITETDKFECWMVLEGEKQLLALIVYDRSKKQELEIPLLWVGDNPLAATIAHHLLFQSASLSAREQRQFTRITDPCLQEIVTTAIQKDTFVKVKNGWLRANIAVAETALNLSNMLTSLSDSLGQEYGFCHKIASNLVRNEDVIDIRMLLDIERFISPAKIIDADIPTFIVPIKPFWAQQLFDSKLASQTLMGATKTEIALNREAIYYKSKNAPKELKPGVSGRILWYVSNNDADHGYYGVSAVRACSRFDEVVIGKPKALYRRFRNLGIYEEKNVFEVAKNEFNKEIMAIRFSDTELFNKPIFLKTVQEICEKQLTMQNASYISKESFAKIYTLGIHT